MFLLKCLWFLGDNKGNILSFFHVLHFSFPTKHFSNGRYSERSLLVQEGMIMEFPNLPKAENTEFEFPNIMILSTLHILSESLHLFSYLGLGGHTAL